MDWPTIEPGLTAIAKTITGLDLVQWEDSPDVFGEKAYVILNVLDGVRSKGVDDRTYSDVPADPAPLLSFPAPLGSDQDQIETVSGLRYFTLSFRVLSYDQSPDSTARVFLERARTRLRWTSTLEALQALELCLVRTHPLIVPQRTLDDRVRSFATMDVELGTTSIEADVDHSIGFISRAGITSHLRDASGVLPVPPNVTNEVIP